MTNKCLLQEVSTVTAVRNPNLIVEYQLQCTSSDGYYQCGVVGRLHVHVYLVKGLAAKYDIHALSISSLHVRNLL